MTSTPATIAVVFGTRPDAVKLAPVIRALVRRPDIFTVRTIFTAQHRDLVAPVLEFFSLRPDHDLNVMRPEQSSTDIASDVIRGLATVYAAERPALTLVQGDTTTALAAALAAFYMKVPVGHVEAGLRTDDRLNPFPEEMNRRLISRLADLHFAATIGNRDALVAEGIDPATVFVTGNPVIDALRMIVDSPVSDALDSPDLPDLSPSTKLVVLTTHRRENFGEPQRNIFRAVNAIVERNPDVVVVFPIHPNPIVRRSAEAFLRPHPRIRVVAPLDYIRFVRLMGRAYLVMTDSGGIQEEGPALGKPVVILRSNTERGEVVEAGLGIMAGVEEESIIRVVDRLLNDAERYARVARPAYPFGDGNAAASIADILSMYLAGQSSQGKTWMPAVDL